MNSTVDTSAILDAVRSWLNTPYKHQHSTKGLGCDCLGLVRGVYLDVYGRQPEKPPPYTAAWRDSEKTEKLLEAANRHLTESTLDEELPQVLVFRMQRNFPAKHCGITVSADKMIHAYEGAGRVEESTLVPYWRNRIVGVFNFPEIVK